MTLKQLSCAFAVAIFAAVSGAQSATLNFNELDHGAQFAVDETKLKKRITGAVIKARSSGNLFAFNTGEALADGRSVSDENGAICAIGADGDCTGTMVIRLLGEPKRNLTFDAVLADAGDRATIKVFGESGRLDRIVVRSDSDTFVDLSGLTGVTRLVINSKKAGGGGFAFANVSFEDVPPVSTPLPAAGVLLLAGFGGLFMMRRRRQS